ncbi:MAG: PmoA family protein [Armatimonadota bacterium]|nr:PmoA family protein [Armatimonadota bacterium]MCX7776715.1 PmoA family protein [Armatimonadota bacterium]MDW8025784.1 PmoA family protein [Armatimonadota bacterium]
MRFKVNAGPYIREHAPIEIPLPADIVGRAKRQPAHQFGEPCEELTEGLRKINAGEFAGTVAARVGEGRRELLIPVQVEKRDGGNFGTLILPRVDPNDSVSIKLTEEECTAPFPVSLKHVEDECKVEVTVGGMEFTAYQYSGRYVRPFLYPVIGPFGKHITRELEGDPAKGFDHVHHRSLYTAWGDVNGVDVWSEQGAHGYVRHHCLSGYTLADVYGRLCAHATWTDNSGKPLMEQVTCYQFYGMPDSHRLIDVAIAFHAIHGDVRFGDTKEGGIISVRVYPTMTVLSGGRLENSYGAINEAHVWGKRAHWCDYSGLVDGVWVGIAIFDHPRNIRHPTYWHARDYGLMTANPFGLSEFLGKGYDGSYTLLGNQWLIFRYRVYLHVGDASVGRVREHYLNYIAPPSVEVVEA